MTINEAIITFCHMHMGQRVGDGQCAALAVEALRYAGARPHSSFLGSPDSDDYVWGEFIFSSNVTNGIKVSFGTGNTVIAGDIIQYNNVEFRWSVLDNGRTITYSSTASHHTAIVSAVRGDDPNYEFDVLEQNTGPGYLVDEERMKVKTGLNITNFMTNGNLLVYRALPNP